MISISPQLSGVIEAKEKIPIGRVEIYDTSYTVPSSGFFVKYYSGVDISKSGSLVRTQFESTLMKDWSNGLPVELSRYVGGQLTNSGVIVADPFAIIYSGYFYASKSGDYKFATRSTGGTNIVINNGSNVLTNTVAPLGFSGISSGQWSDKPFYWYGTYNLNSGWVPFGVQFFWNPSQGMRGTAVGAKPFITALYTAPGENERETVISASTFHIHSGYIQPRTLSDIIFINENIDETQSSQCTFEVSVKYSGIYSWNRRTEDFGFLKINKLCSIFAGYATESGYYQTSGYTSNLDSCTDYIQKFTGLIDSISFEQSSDSVTATVKCRDFFKKYINGINENYPNASNYLPAVVNNLDRPGTFNIDSIMPMAYDNWLIFDVIENISLNAGIDPQRLNRNNWDKQSYFKLESNLNWPFTTVVDAMNVETKNADPYLFKFEYGELLFDEVRRVSDLIGYNCRFDEKGNLLLLDPRRTNSVEIYETGNYASKSLSYSGSWTAEFDSNALNRFYITPVSTGNFTSGIMSFNFNGVGFGLYQFVHPSGAMYDLKIQNKLTNQIVYSGIFTNSGVTEYSNQVIFTKNLIKDDYVAYIYPSGDVRFEGFEYYSANIYQPVYTFRDDRDILDLSVDMSDTNLRNEIIVVGQQIADKGYIYSKAIDLDSINNPEAFNYVGQKKTFTLIEPTIQSQRRVDWLSSVILERFRRKQRNIQLSTQGLPHLQIGDPVGIISNYGGLDTDSAGAYDINNNEVYYITNISSKMEDSKYTSTFSLTSLKPIESWRTPVPITRDLLDSIYRNNNNTIFKDFRQLTLNSDNGYGYDGFSEQAAFISFDCLVDVDRLWVMVSDKMDGGAVFKFIDITSKDPDVDYNGISNSNDPTPNGIVPLHDGGGEKWGNIVVPTAQNNFNGGQWAGQNSAQNIRKDGVYPIAIWAQFRTGDNVNVFQGMWVPRSGIDIDPRNICTGIVVPNSSGNIHYQFNGAAGRMFNVLASDTTKANLPGFVVKNQDFKVDMFLGPVSSGIKFVNQNRLTNLSGMFSYFGDHYSTPAYDGYMNALINNNGTETKTLSLAAPGAHSWDFPTSTPLVGARAGLGPFRAGSGVLYSGTKDAFEWSYDQLLSSSAPDAVNRAGNKYLEVKGFTPQWFNIVQSYPDWHCAASGNWLYNYYLPNTNTPASTTSPSKSLYISGIDCLFHELNYITVQANHDFKLNISVIAYDPNYYWQNSAVNIYHYSPYLLYQGSLTRSTKGPLATYWTDTILAPDLQKLSAKTRNYSSANGINWTARAFRQYNDPIEITKYKGPHNVMYSQRVAPYFGGDCFINSSTQGMYNGHFGIADGCNSLVLLRYIFIESKTGNQYTVMMRVNYDEKMFTSTASFRGASGGVVQKFYRIL